MIGRTFFRSSGQRPADDHDDRTTSPMSVKSLAERWPSERKKMSTDHRTVTELDLWHVHSRRLLGVDGETHEVNNIWWNPFL